MKLRRWAPAALLGAVVLTGCSGLTPGTAAVVDGTRITNAEVNDLTKAQCVAADQAAKGGSSQPTATSSLKMQSLSLLMDTQLSLHYAEDEKIAVDKSLADNLYGQFESSIDALPASARPVLADTFQEWAKGRAVLISAGSKATGTQPDSKNLQQLLDAGLKQRGAWLKGITIDTDSRYAPSRNGSPGGGQGSVSQATSTFAKGARSTQPDASFVSGLPANQKCG